MMRRQRIAVAAASLAVGGSVVLMAVTSTAGAIAPAPNRAPVTTPSGPAGVTVATTPSGPAGFTATTAPTSTMSVPRGHRDTSANGPLPTATVSATGGCAENTEGNSAPPVTVVVTPSERIPGSKPVTGAPAVTATVSPKR